MPFSLRLHALLHLRGALSVVEVVNPTDDTVHDVTFVVLVRGQPVLLDRLTDARYLEIGPRSRTVLPLALRVVPRPEVTYEIHVERRRPDGTPGGAESVPWAIDADG